MSDSETLLAMAQANERLRMQVADLLETLLRAVASFDDLADALRHLGEHELARKTAWVAARGCEAAIRKARGE